MVEDGSAVQGNARQGAVPALSTRPPLWLVRTWVLVEEIGVLHGPGLTPQVPFPVAGVYPLSQPLVPILLLEVCDDPCISSCVPLRSLVL